MLEGMGPIEDSRRGRRDHGTSSGNIFSFNLVEKLKRLGLDKVVARGRVDPDNKRPTAST